jgi:Tol biopolymer transport system component
MLQRAFFAVCCLLLTPTLTAQSSPAPRRVMTVEDLWAMERVGEPVVSPDGQWVVFTVNRISMATNKGNSDLWLVPVDGSRPPRQLTFNEGADGSPAWSPDGRGARLRPSSTSCRSTAVRPRP